MDESSDDLEPVPAFPLDMPGRAALSVGTMRSTRTPQRAPPDISKQAAKETRYDSELDYRLFIFAEMRSAHFQKHLELNDDQMMQAWESLKKFKFKDTMSSLFRPMDVEDIPAEFVEEDAAIREHLAVEAQAGAAKQRRVADAAPTAAGKPKAAGLPLAPLTSPLLLQADPPGTYVC